VVDSDAKLEMELNRELEKKKHEFIEIQDNTKRIIKEPRFNHLQSTIGEVR